MGDRYPNCVKLRLELAAQGSAMRVLSNAIGRKPPLDLALSINFSDRQEVPFMGRSICFGITQGELLVTLERCQLPLQGVKEARELQREGKFGRETTPKAGIAGTLNLEGIGIEANIGEERTETTTVTLYQVEYAGGDDRTPSWYFKAFGDKDRKTLKGKLDCTLGTIDVESRPCRARATFKVRGEHLRVTGGSFLATKNIGRNQWAFIERAIALNHLKTLIESAPVCEWEVSHG